MRSIHALVGMLPAVCSVGAARRELARQWSMLAATCRTAHAESAALDVGRAALAGR